MDAPIPDFLKTKYEYSCAFKYLPTESTDTSSNKYQYTP